MIINKLFQDRRLEQILLRVRVPNKFKVLSYSEGSITTTETPKMSFTPEEDARFEYVARRILTRDQHFTSYSVDVRSAKIKSVAKLVKIYCQIHHVRIPHVEDDHPISLKPSGDTAKPCSASKLMSTLRFISEMSEDKVIRRTFTHAVDNDILNDWTIEEEHAEPDIALCLWLAKQYSEDLYEEWLACERIAHLQQKKVDSCGVTDNAYTTLMLVYAKLMWLGSYLGHTKRFRSCFPETAVADVRSWFNGVGAGAFDTAKVSLGPDTTSRRIITKDGEGSKFYWLHGLLSKAELYGPHPSWIGCKWTSDDEFDFKFEIINQKEIVSTQKYDLLWNVIDDRKYSNVAESAADIGTSLILKLLRFLCNPLQEGRFLYFSDALKTHLLAYGRMATVEWGSALPVNFYHAYGEMAFVSWKSIINESMANVVYNPLTKVVASSLKSRTMVGSGYEIVVKNKLPSKLSVDFVVGDAGYTQAANQTDASNEFTHVMKIEAPTIKPEVHDASV